MFSSVWESGKIIHEEEILRGKPKEGKGIRLR